MTNGNTLHLIALCLDNAFPRSPPWGLGFGATLGFWVERWEIWEGRWELSISTAVVRFGDGDLCFGNLNGWLVVGACQLQICGAKCCETWKRLSIRSLVWRCIFICVFLGWERIPRFSENWISFVTPSVWRFSEYRLKTNHCIWNIYRYGCSTPPSAVSEWGGFYDIMKGLRGFPNVFLEFGSWLVVECTRLCIFRPQYSTEFCAHTLDEDVPLFSVGYWQFVVWQCTGYDLYKQGRSIWRYFSR